MLSIGYYTLVEHYPDLAEGVIRTPLAPKETFLDDPLRMLRLVRFSTRFTFPIDEKALLAMQDKQVQVFLQFYSCPF